MWRCSCWRRGGGAVPWCCWRRRTCPSTGPCAAQPRQPLRHCSGAAQVRVWMSVVVVVVCVWGGVYFSQWGGGRLGVRVRALSQSSAAHSPLQLTVLCSEQSSAASRLLRVPCSCGACMPEYAHACGVGPDTPCIRGRWWGGGGSARDTCTAVHNDCCGSLRPVLPLRLLGFFLGGVRVRPCVRVLGGLGYHWCQLASGRRQLSSSIARGTAPSPLRTARPWWRPGGRRGSWYPLTTPTR